MRSVAQACGDCSAVSSPGISFKRVLDASQSFWGVAPAVTEFRAPIRKVVLQGCLVDEDELFEGGGGEEFSVGPVEVNLSQIRLFRKRTTELLLLDSCLSPILHYLPGSSGRLGSSSPWPSARHGNPLSVCRMHHDRAGQGQLHSGSERVQRCCVRRLSSSL
jgi:hypothetical protein